MNRPRMLLPEDYAGTVERVRHVAAGGLLPSTRIRSKWNGNCAQPLENENNPCASAAQSSEPHRLSAGGCPARPRRVPTSRGIIGYESGTTVSPDYTAHTSRFNGKIAWVQIDLGEDAKDADHYVDHDERVRVMMARQ